MQKITKSIWIGPFISGLLTFIAVCQVNFFASWICYIPLFISINNASLKTVFKKGIVFGLVFSAATFFWMIPGAERFTGYSIFYGLGVFLIAVIFLSLYHAAVLFCFAVIKKNNDELSYILLNSVLAASFFCVGEALLMNVSAGFPWFDMHSGTGLASNDYTIQPASVFGVHILTFIVVLVNYLLAWCIAKRLWAKLYIPVTAIALYMITGFFLLKNFENKSNTYKPFKVAILAGNIAPEMKWDNNTGNFLVQKLLDLNRAAVASKPNMALWSESAIPWTYKKDDDLVKEILSISAPARVVHILGINTAYTDNIVFNSAYCILPGGEVTSRYDKQFLLSLIEKPLGGLIMPFFSSGGFSATSDKQHAAPLNTPYGKAGMLICNEAAIPAAAANMVKQGAQFLLNMSNDGWFNDTYIVRMHFYCARLRAVESRKDLAINSNNGYSGLIKASGIIVEKERSEDPFIEMVSIQPNDVMGTAVAFPNIFIYSCAAFLVLTIAFNLVNRK
ncbi:MAG: apolipoprotein N-acyltransferase [Ferruginibacter sp.]